MLCAGGTHAVDLWQPLFFLDIFSGIAAAFLLALMLCTVGTHAVHVWQPWDLQLTSGSSPGPFIDAIIKAIHKNYAVA